MTDADIDRAIHEVTAIAPSERDRAIYRAGVAAGLEAAAKVCEEQGRNAGDGMTFYTATGQCAAAIRALKEQSK